MIGELRCLNCSRHLADVVDGDRGLPRVTPPSGHPTAPILVVRTTRGLRCARCGGRALLEQLLGKEAVKRDGSTGERLTPAA